MTAYCKPKYLKELVMPSLIMSCEGKLMRTSYFLSNGSRLKVNETTVNERIEELCEKYIMLDETTGHLSAMLYLIKKRVKHD